MLVIVAASEAIQKAHRVARQYGREDVCQALSKGAWDIANALSLTVKNDVEVTS